MEKKILIGYYSKTGTTRKVCEQLMTSFTKAEFQVDLKEFSQISELASYDIVFIAAPINGMQWVESAREFVKSNQAILKRKKVVAILVSYIIRNGNRFWQKKIRAGVASITAGISPITIKDFGGVVNQEFPAFARMIFGIKRGASPDASNDEEVERFAEMLLEEFLNE